jgi:uncharacterized protein YjbI with pentapeptide repeats
MPDITTFIRLAELLGVDLNYFSGNFHPSGTISAPAELLEKQTDDLPTEKYKKKNDWDMSFGNWVDADFSGLKNLHEKFGSSNMQRCLFIGSDLSGLHLINNNVENCDFSGSEISSSHFQSSHLGNNKFRNCSLKESEFSGSYIYGCDFTDADLTGVIVKTGGFEKNTIAGTVWNRTRFVDTHLVDSIFEGTLEDCSFENCAFTKIKFQNTTLVNTFFKNNRKLKKVQFINCKVDKITYSFLQSGMADLTGVTLVQPGNGIGQREV